MSIVEGKDIILRPFSEEFLTESYVSWLNDKEVTKYSNQRLREHTLDSCRDYVKSMHEAGNYFWAITTREGDKHIGNITAYIIEKNSIADIAIMVGDLSFQGRGFGLQAWKLACSYLLENDIVKKATAGTLSVNIPMQKLMEKSGMTVDRVSKNHEEWQGQSVDMLYASVTKDQLIK